MGSGGDQAGGKGPGGAPVRAGARAWLWRSKERVAASASRRASLIARRVPSQPRPPPRALSSSAPSPISAPSPPLSFLPRIHARQDIPRPLHLPRPQPTPLPLPPLAPPALLPFPQAQPRRPRHRAYSLRHRHAPPKCPSRHRLFALRPLAHYPAPHIPRPVHDTPALADPPHVRSPLPRRPSPLLCPTPGAPGKFSRPVAAPVSSRHPGPTVRRVATEPTPTQGLDIRLQGMRYVSHEQGHESECLFSYAFLRPLQSAPLRGEYYILNTPLEAYAIDMCPTILTA